LGSSLYGNQGIATRLERLKCRIDLQAVVVVDRQLETFELGSGGPTRMIVLQLDSTR